jgi:hypothetical protein
MRYNELKSIVINEKIVPAKKAEGFFW